MKLVVVFVAAVLLPGMAAADHFLFPTKRAAPAAPLKPLDPAFVSDDNPACSTDADCPRSYCMNDPPHQPPFHCQSNPELVCPPWPIKNLTCHHGGSLYAPGCTVNSDCPDGYCLNYAPHKPPYTCQSYKNPICECDCVSNWIGPECQTWNSTSGGGNNNNNKIINYLNTLAAKQRSALADNQYLNPLSGSLGYGVDITAGSTGLPVAYLTYQNPNLTYSGHTLPEQAKFTPYVSAGSKPTKVSSFSKAFTGVSSYRSYLQTAQAGATQELEDFVGHLHLGEGTTMQATWKEYFSDDFALGISQQMFEAFEMEFASGTQYLDRHVMLALQSLPPSYSTDSEITAYKKFISLWGTHYVSRVINGGVLEAVSKWDYAIYRHDGMSTTSISTQVGYDREILSGLSASGSPLSSDPTLNSDYKATRQLDPLNCYGGNPEDCSKARMSSWLTSIADAAVPVRMQLAPVSDLISDPDVKTAFSKAALDYQNSINGEWNAVKTCPRCQYGTCSGDAEACTCAGKAYNRLCDTCPKLYGGSDCNTPQCPNGCNAANGKCTAPNTCTCDSCWDGPACTKYTCGCFEGTGTVLTIDNRTLPLTEVKLGDVVQAVDASGKAVWSDVFFLRNSGSGEKELTELILEDDRKLRLTHDHLVYVTPTWRSSAPIPSPAFERMAEEVKVGEYVWVRSPAAGEDATFTMLRVTGVKTSTSVHPLVTVHTLAGPVVVDGVVASSYEYSSALRYFENLEDRVVYMLFPEFAKSPAYAAYQDAWDFYVGEPVHMAMRAVMDAASAAPVYLAGLRTWFSGASA